jgi:hypothetical protein
MNIPAVNAYQDVHRVEVHQRLVAVIALVGDDLFQRRKNEQRAFIKYPRTFMKFLYRKRFFSSGLASMPESLTSSATQLTEIPRGSNTTSVPRTNRRESHDRGKSREEDEREVAQCAHGGERRIRES